MSAKVLYPGPRNPEIDKQLDEVLPWVPNARDLVQRVQLTENASISTRNEIARGASFEFVGGLSVAEEQVPDALGEIIMLVPLEPTERVTTYSQLETSCKKLFGSASSSVPQILREGFDTLISDTTCTTPSHHFVRVVVDTQAVVAGMDIITHTPDGPSPDSDARTDANIHSVKHCFLCVETNLGCAKYLVSEWRAAQLSNGRKYDWKAFLSSDCYASIQTRTRDQARKVATRFADAIGSKIGAPSTESITPLLWLEDAGTMVGLHNHSKHNRAPVSQMRVVFDQGTKNDVIAGRAGPGGFLPITPGLKLAISTDSQDPLWTAGVRDSLLGDTWRTSGAVSLADSMMIGKKAKEKQDSLVSKFQRTRLTQLFYVIAQIPTAGESEK